MSGNYNKKQDIRLYRYFNFTEFLFPFLGIVLVFSVPFAHFQEIFLLQVNTLMNKAWWFLGQYSLEYTLSWTWIKKLLTIDEYYTLSTFSCQSYVFRRRKSCFRYSVVFFVRSGDWIETEWEKFKIVKGGKMRKQQLNMMPKNWGVCQLSGGMECANCRKLNFNCTIKIQTSIIRQKIS